jgi:hypothetical protein
MSKDLIRYLDPKFKNHKDVIKLDDEIYLYKNFFKKDLIDLILEGLAPFDLNQSKKEHFNYEEGDISHLFTYGRISHDIGFYLLGFHDNIVNLIAPEYWTNKMNSLIRMLPGDLHEPTYTNFTPVEEVEIKIEYKICAFFGDFTGGEIYFPDRQIEYKPNSGDLIIFSSNPEYRNGVKKILSGVRYSYMDFMYQYPGLFIA